MDAAGARRFAEPVFMIGAMDINVAGASIDIIAKVHTWLQSTQPEDAGGD